MNRNHLLMAALAGLVLAGCGGGSGDAPAPPPAATDAVPDSASRSAAGLASYVVDLSVAQADDKEPLDLAPFSPQQADDSEPEAIK